jgi:hypothetical protein
MALCAGSWRSLILFRVDYPSAVELAYRRSCPERPLQDSNGRYAD